MDEILYINNVHYTYHIYTSEHVLNVLLTKVSLVQFDMVPVKWFTGRNVFNTSIWYKVHKIQTNTHRTRPLMQTNIFVRKHIQIFLKYILRCD